MILGIGIDMVDMRRIGKSLPSLKKRIFTDAERKKAEGRRKADKNVTIATYAKHFAAKEACAKALGTGIKGMSWREIEVTNDKLGAPAMRLSGGALKRLTSLTPRGMKPMIHVSLSDEYPYALAQVIISAETL